MFIITLKYIVDLKSHIDFLQKHYDLGFFIMSGPISPRTGGIIIADCASAKQVDEIIKQDPFYQNSIAEYSVTEFIPKMVADEFKKYEAI